MIHAYRLVYPLTQHAPPQLWAYEQPNIDHLIRNARTLNRQIVQSYFEDWAVLDRDNRWIWETYYHPKPLFDHMPTWHDWLRDYQRLIIEVQDMAKDHTVQGTKKKPGNAYERSR